ncbi:MAG: M36 family metallopeptidase [Actinomycetota bacterium]
MSKTISRPLFGLLIALLMASALTGTAGARKRPGGGTSATGRVFLPNPVADLQDQTLTDQKDADYAALQPAYHEVTLTDLDGSGYLVGKWANVVSETGDPAYSSSGSFLFGRSDDRFEQVMAYYWVTESQRYIQSLGFGSSRRPINMESQDVRINQWGVDNSYSWDKHDVLRFGKGGVDDAEDAEVILHEYGHAMHDSQISGLAGTGDAGAIGEGFGDYWAVTVSNVVAPTPDAPCVADWDSVSYTSTTPHCLRRTDLDVQYPGDLAASIHRRGQIWSRALWDIRQALGATTADTIILEAQFDFAPDTTMPAAAEGTVATAERLYNRGVAHQVRTAFEDRGIL